MQCWQIKHSSVIYVGLIPFLATLSRVAGEAWGKPLISQKTKAMLAIVLDISHQSFSGPGVPFAAHVLMALRQGATFAELEELMTWACVYCGFNKAAGAFGRLNELKEEYKDQFPEAL